MKIYFYDGCLYDVLGMKIGAEPYLVVDASFGPKSNIEYLENLRRQNRTDDVVLTNSIIALSTQYGWNFKENHIDIYLWVKELKEFVRIDKLTDKEIRVAHCIDKMYLAGVFDVADYYKTSHI